MNFNIKIYSKCKSWNNESSGKSRYRLTKEKYNGANILGAKLLVLFGCLFVHLGQLMGMQVRLSPSSFHSFILSFFLSFFLIVCLFIYLLVHLLD